MKKYRFLIWIFLILSLTSFSFTEEWKIIREKKTEYEYIELAESDTGLCTLTASTTYKDGTLIFYCHAGVRDKKHLLNVYENLELNLEIDSKESVVNNASSQINHLRHTGVINLIKFEQEPPVYSDGYILQNSHVYCDSWLDKAVEKILKKNEDKNKI